MQHVQLTLDDRVYGKVRELATAAGYKPSQYAQILFDAAFASKVGVATDTSIDAMIARVLILHSRRLHDTGVIARAIGLSEPTVIKIIEAWKAETQGEAK